MAKPTSHSLKATPTQSSVTRSPQKPGMRRTLTGAWLDVSTVCTLYGPSERSLWAMVARGIIPFRRLQKRVVFQRSELDQWFSTLPGVSLEQAQQNAERRAMKQTVNRSRAT